MKADTQQQILAAGRIEFLDKGFQDASLRRIAQRAGVTTGAIYGYYADKAALFEALVEPAATQFRNRFQAVQAAFAALPPAEQITGMREYSSQSLQDLLDDVYAHADAFRLIVCRSAGTVYEDYIEGLVEAEAEATAQFVATMQQAGHPVATLSENLRHILANAYFSAVFEIVAHEMTKEEADAYVHQITTFFQAGWQSLLHFT